jgi:hypothetical protein
MNPFEQLEFFVLEPRRAFGEIVEMILRDRFDPGVRGPCEADGPIEVVGPSPGSPQGVTLWFWSQRKGCRWPPRKGVKVRSAVFVKPNPVLVRGLWGSDCSCGESFSAREFFRT